MKVTSLDGRVLVPITRRRAWALMMFGPADSWDNPLCGTRYDPVLRQRVDHVRWTAREQRRETRRPAPVLQLIEAGMNDVLAGQQLA